MKKNEMRIADSNFDRIQARNGLAAKNASQMSKIIPMLQIGSKKGPDEEEVIERYGTRLEALERISAEFVEATKKLDTMHRVDRLRQLKRLTDCLEWFRALKASKPPQGLSAAMRKAINTLVSLREFVYVEGNALLPEQINLVTLTDFRTKLEQLVSKTRQDLRKTREGEETILDPVFSPDVAGVITDVENGTTLPSLGDAPFAVARVPVIAVAKSLLTATQLRKWGFAVVELGGYPVLSNQLVLGVKGGLEEAEEHRKALRKHTKQKLAFVDTKPQGATGLHWYWLMSEDNLSHFASAFPGKSLQLRSWGFAIHHTRSK